ncbi:ATP-binding cassette domain-containing protein [Nonomuraea sp. CA-141351]|uniref:ATP-binding cassette domain-containing protein n=1 Tax=Nonomuraea sp. CA-141351 TaxID=3239996 RepID=UPI003D8E6093
MIQLNGLTKRHGDVLAVDDLTFTVRPGLVTGFLGPNGAGKTTTMRMILGLDLPTSGTATINGRAHHQPRHRLREVGSMLEEAARVFDRFYRTDGSRTRTTGGAGLGPAIVRSIVATHGGRVEVRSAPGEGAAFQVRLPAADSH